MSRAARTLGALVAVVCCCLTAGAVTPASASPASPASPASAAAPAPVAPPRPPVSIESLTPSRLVPGTPVRVSGTVYNNTDGVWGDAQVGMLVSPVPFTSRSQVAAATQADPYEGFLGRQVLEPGTFDDIGDVAPGQSRSFTFTVPYDELDLSGGEGVYHVGAELRVTDQDGLRGSAARDLTFMPLVDDAGGSPTVDLAMLWPVIAPVPWDGTEFVEPTLSEQFVVNGRLRSLAELAGGAGDFPLTWVLDPAVLDAARRMSDGFTVDGREVAADSLQATAAAEWLDLVTGAVGGSLALAVPYADPDVAALAHADIRPGMRKAQRAGERVLDRLRISALTLLWPGNGRTDREVLRDAQQFDPDLALLSRATFDRRPQGAAVTLRTHTLPTAADPEGGMRTWQSLVVDPPRDRHGLRAQPGQTPLQWRQLILADTALRSLSGIRAQRTVIAMPSERWWPAAASESDLFDGLRVPWLNPVPVAEMLTSPAPRYDGGFRYPRSARRHELDRPLLRTVRRLRRTASTVSNLLTDPTEHRREVDRAFGLSSSLAWREDPQTGLRIASRFVSANEEKVRGIDLESPSFVTLSSDSGRFPLSVTNRLEQPVTIRLSVDARDPRMRVAPIDPVTLQQDQRVTVSVVMNSRGVGITTVTARMQTQTGKPFGRLASFQVRTTQIGAVVWVLMAIGGGVLFVAAARRITLRVRRHRRRSTREAT